MNNRIMSAFIAEIQQNGMKFTMDDLAKRLGISKRTLYEHFPSKGDILEAIIDQTFNDINEITERIIRDDKLTIIEKIRGLITTLPKHWELYDLRILEQMKRYFPEQWAKIDSALKDDWAALRVLIEQGIREGEIVDVNVPLVMKMIIDATNSTLDQRFYRDNQITVTDALSSIVDVLLNGLIPRDKKK
ncbi:TetR/AcrR family transcriptional regulator [Brevibacillus ginsengisoli]|uniref:TetR/AcrR family transcriptional regulator n=1 Tax=Brevibacillus ginsengisoli TaxID=363854 RepID=UPI003CEEFC49